jgi:hypothetical protein
LKRKITITMLLVLTTFSVWYFYPKTYSEMLHGVYYHLGNEEVFETIELHIDGKLQNHITGKKTFDGEVSWKGNGVPLLSNNDKLKLYYESGKIGIIATYFSEGEGGVAVAEGDIYGMVYINEDFSEFMLRVYSKDTVTDNNDEFMITAPANSRAEALDITERLLKDYRRVGDTFVYDPKNK